MTPYENQAGDSGVEAYELGKGSITIRFRGGATYHYTVKSAGARNIARMQRLAERGRGLSTFVSREVRDRYERQLS